jgi:hypothetical protein
LLARSGRRSRGQISSPASRPRTSQIAPILSQVSTRLISGKLSKTCRKAPPFKSNCVLPPFAACHCSTHEITLSRQVKPTVSSMIPQTNADQTARAGLYPCAHAFSVSSVSRERMQTLALLKIERKANGVSDPPAKPNRRSIGVDGCPHRADEKAPVRNQRRFRRWHVSAEPGRGDPIFRTPRWEAAILGLAGSRFAIVAREERQRRCS